ncbi:MAG: DUF3667 domain-containing protein [Bacteroidia bacterium]
MSSSKHLREENDCLNCGETVQGRFCGHCGQENVVSQQSVSHLVYHFFEDITHYEGKFWKTIRFLLLKPAFLTKEFLSGKRMKYVPPVRLYIFISFVTFFLPYILPSTNSDNSLSYEEKKSMSLAADSNLSESFSFFKGNYGWSIWIPVEYSSVKELDDFQLTLEKEKRLKGLDLWAEKKMIELSKRNPFELADRFFSSLSKNIAKALFIIMPIFALILMLFHLRKKWYYFDHAIFTIHLFSFLLLIVSIFNILSSFKVIATETIADSLIFLSIFGSLLVFPVYFFVAHKKMYSESLFISSLKSIGVLAVSMIFLVVILIILAVFSLFSVA